MWCWPDDNVVLASKHATLTSGNEGEHVLLVIGDDVMLANEHGTLTIGNERRHVLREHVMLAGEHATLTCGNERELVSGVWALAKWRLGGVATKSTCSRLCSLPPMKHKTRTQWRDVEKLRSS